MLVREQEVESSLKNVVHWSQELLLLKSFGSTLSQPFNKQVQHKVGVEGGYLVKDACMPNQQICFKLQSTLYAYKSWVVAQSLGVAYWTIFWSYSAVAHCSELNWKSLLHTAWLIPDGNTLAVKWSSFIHLDTL